MIFPIHSWPSETSSAPPRASDADDGAGGGGGGAFTGGRGSRQLGGALTLERPGERSRPKVAGGALKLT